MSRILGKFVQDSTITDLQIRLRNNLALRARNAGDTADLEVLKISNTDVLTVLRQMSMNGARITDLLDPVNPQDAATKSYVEAIVSGLSDPKDAVRLATSAALPASTYDNGTNGVGATITADSNGAISAIDGVTPSASDRILVKTESAAIRNGIYALTQVGDAGTPWILTRATDANNDGSSAAAVTRGMFTQAVEGVDNGSLGFILTTSSSGGDPKGELVLGTDQLTFAQMGETIQAGQGLTKNGQTLAIDNGLGLGFDGSDRLVVLVDDDLVNGTIKLLVGGQVAGRKTFEEEFTLSNTDITNGYVDLQKVASNESTQLFPRFGIKQRRTVDFTVVAQGGASSKTRVTFAGDLASILEDGDIIDIAYESLDY